MTWSGLLDVAWSERGDLLRTAAVHLNLVLQALGVAVLVGVPLGIVATRSRWLERLILGLANVLQTIPSLAMLGFFLIVWGRIGTPPAMLALILYALLPIIKNTILGIRSLDRGVAEAALGMGMTVWQRLWLVELPLAVPIILGGVRVATVAAVGLATIAAAIGAGGLGTYIFRGIQVFSPSLILLGAIPAAILALACDAALGEVERWLDPRQSRRALWRSGLAAVAIAALIGLAVWGGLPQRAARPGAATVVIGSKNFSEAILLGQMLAQLVEDHTALNVETKLNLDGFFCYNALRAGQIDAYVEYTGTALTAILKRPPRSDPQAVRNEVCAALAEQGIRCLEPLGFNNTFAILMRRQQAERLGLQRLSDLRRHADTLRAGFGTEFMSRQDGYPGLVAAYGLDFAHPPIEMDLNLLYQALHQGSIDLAAGNSTDGRIEAFDLVALEDDLGYFPPYEAIPLVGSDAAQRHPEFVAAIARLTGRLDARTMRHLNHEIDGLGRDPAQVARDFLAKLPDAAPSGADSRP